MTCTYVTLCEWHPGPAGAATNNGFHYRWIIWKEHHTHNDTILRCEKAKRNQMAHLPWWKSRDQLLGFTLNTCIEQSAQSLLSSMSLIINQSFKCQKILKNTHYKFPEPKVTSSNCLLWLTVPHNVKYPIFLFWMFVFLLDKRLDE